MEGPLNRIELVMPCPVQECIEENEQLYQWKHKKCKQVLYLDREGQIICDKCKLNANLIDFKFNCKVGHKDDVEPTSIGLCKAFTFLAQIHVEPMVQVFVAEVTGKVLQQFMIKDENADEYVEKLKEKCKDYYAEGFIVEQ